MYLHNNTPGHSPGFVKVQIALDEAWWTDSLRRESEAPAALQAMGLRTPRTLTHFTEISGQFGLIELERITSPGVMLSNEAEITTADSWLGELAARTILSASGRALVFCPELAALKRTDKRNRTYSTLVAELEKADLALAESPFLVGPLRARYLEAVTGVSQLSRAMPSATVVARGVGEFFVHNDASPMNLFFPEGEFIGQLLDLEFAGATKHQPLAWLTDLGHFYGRAWCNQNMQRSFVKALAAELPVASPLARQIVFLAVLTGALIEAGEHCLDPAGQLLVETLSANLESHLALI